MTREQFNNYVKDKSIEYNISTPPMKAQEALNILNRHLLGEDWYIVDPLNQEQANTCIVMDIIRKYPDKRDTFLGKILDNLSMWLSSLNKR